jgi:hypothetical protein
MMKRILMFSLLAFCATSLFGQASKLIPNDAVAVMSIHSESFEKKVDMDKVWQMEIFKEFDTKAKTELKENYDIVSRIYKEPSKAGVNLFPRSYGYVQKADEMVFMAQVFNMASKDKFEDFLKNGLMKSGPQMTIEKSSGFEYIFMDEAALAWNDKAIMFATVQGDQKGLYEGLDYDDEAYYEKLDERRKKFATEKKAMLVKKLSGVIAKNVTAISNSNFMEFKKATHDVGMWLNMDYISQFIAESAMNESSMKMEEAKMMEYLAGITEDSYYHALVNFKAGEAEMDIKTYTNEKMFDLYKGVYSKNINPDFFNYVNGGQLLGFASVAIDIEKAVAATLEVYKPMMAEIPQYGKMSGSVLDLLGIAIDEKALAGVLKGDVLVALTDVAEKEVKYIDYEYDEDYNMTKVEKTRKQTVPMYVAEMTIGNKDDLMKILGALKSFQIISEKDNMYSVTAPGMEIEVNMIVKNNLLVISNDMNLLKNGASKSNRLNTTIQAEALKNNTFMYMNFQNLFSKIMEVEEMSGSDKLTMQYFKSMFSHAKFKGTEVGDKMFTNKFVVSMNDKKTNSAMQLFQIANKMYLDDKARQAEYRKKYEVKDAVEEAEDGGKE